MKKVFIASFRIWAPAFVQRISALPVEIDFFGCDSNFKYPTNVNYLGQVLWPFNDVLDYLESNYQQYDLIFLPDFNWQINERFNDFRKSISAPFLCPSYQANEIERNKLFSKKLFDELEIPTPDYFEYQSLEHLENNVRGKFVFKLADDWIHSGHQTMIFEDEKYKKVIPMFYQRGYKGKAYVEEFVEGKEAILHFLCNGSENIYLGSARDYKKIYDNDQGMNVSSTGSYSPVGYINDEIINQVKNFVTKIQSRVDYLGIMCVGIIFNSSDLKVLEINVRPGTPEFLTTLETIEPKNLLDNLVNAAHRIPMIESKFLDVSAVSVQLLHKNYNFEMKKDSTWPDDTGLEDLDVTYFYKEFHNYNYYSSITAVDVNRITASKKIYQRLEKISTGDYRFRSDIGLLD
jgi:phosphoribosylamine--glycine ligase